MLKRLIAGGKAALDVGLTTSRGYVRCLREQRGLCNELYLAARRGITQLRKNLIVVFCTFLGFISYFQGTQCQILRGEHK